MPYLLFYHETNFYSSKLYSIVTNIYLLSKNRTFLLNMKIRIFSLSITCIKLHQSHITYIKYGLILIIKAAFTSCGTQISHWASVLGTLFDLPDPVVLLLLQILGVSSGTGSPPAAGVAAPSTTPTS